MQRLRRVTARELAIIFIFWTSLATLSVVGRLLDPRGYGFRVVSPAGPIALTFLEAWIWAAFTPLIFRLSTRASSGRPRWLFLAPMLLVAGFAISMTIYSAVAIARAEVFESMPRRRNVSAFEPFRDLARFRYANQFLIYLAVLATGFAREYFLRDRDRQAHASQLEAQLVQARLDSLRMQLNPHFLFNTLHAVSALVERDPAGVRRMIARLSELLRHTIDSRGTDEVPLREELDFLRRYIEIMEIRFQGRLHVDVDVPPTTLDALVPNLVLQPLVENALEHGASRVIGEGRIEITAARDGERLTLRVRDNGPGVDVNAPPSTGVGLSNTRARLAQLYGERASLTLAPFAGGGTIAEVVLPFRVEDDDDA
jgi:signal transduction histidine kinase